MVAGDTDSVGPDAHGVVDLRAAAARSRIDDADLAAVMRRSVNPYAIIGDDGTILFVSDPIERIIGIPAADCVGRDVLDFIDPRHHDAVLTAISEFGDPDRDDDGWEGPPISVDLLHADGHPVHCRVLGIGSGREGHPGTVVRIRQTATVSRIDALMSAMITSGDLSAVMAMLIEAIAEQTPGSCAVIGLGWNGSTFAQVVAADEAPCADILPLPTEGAHLPWIDAMTRVALRTMDPVDLPQPLADAAAASGQRACWAFPIELDGSCENVLVIWRPVPGPPTQHILEATVRMVQLARLALNANRSRRALERRARTDPLTGLANRLALFDRLEELADTTDSPIGVLYCDLDDFKPINDRHGHGVGDQVLTIAANRISSQLRSADLVARLGGDEFAILCVGADSSRVAGLARRLVRSFAEPVVVDGETLRVGISVGSAVLDAPEEGWSAADLLQSADDALLAAKSDGKGTWRAAHA